MGLFPGWPPQQVGEVVAKGDELFRRFFVVYMHIVLIVVEGATGGKEHQASSTLGECI